MSRACALSLLLVGAIGCGPSLPTPGATRLVPVTAASAAALHTLRLARSAGPRLERALSLLLLFDHARFARDAASRTLLLDELAVPAADRQPGELLTLRVARGVDEAFAAVTQADQREPEHDGEAKQARRLLGWDVRPPLDLPAALTALSGLRELVETGSPRLRVHAGLRLVDHCLGVFATAMDGPAAARAAQAARCLQGLGKEGSPTAARLRESLTQLADRLARGADPAGLALVAAARQRLDDSLARLATALPPSVDPAALGLPLAGRADPSENTPWVRLTERGELSPLGVLARGSAVDEKLRALAQSDARRRLLVLAPSGTSMLEVLSLGRRAAAAGFGVLELGVRTAHGPSHNGSDSLGVIPLRLHAAAGARGDDCRLGVGTENGLVVEALVGSLRLRTGGVETRVEGSPEALRRALMAQPRGPSGGEPTPIFLVTGAVTQGSGATARLAALDLGAIVRILESIRHDPAGQPLFPVVYLGPPR